MKNFVRLFRAAGIALASILVATNGFAVEAPVRIMPLGDSLTSGTSSYTVQGAYRNRLHALLTGAGYNVDFVGTFSDTANPTLADINHQGAGGALIDQLQANLPGWLATVEDPDVVLLLIGINDFWQNYNIATAPTRLDSLISDIAIRRPFAKIIVSNLPLRTDNPSIEAQQVAFNSAIPGIVAQQVALGRQVSFVDMHSALTPTDINGDGVHPTAAGFDKIGEFWFPAVASVISPQGTTNPPVISRIGIVDLTHLSVVFSKPVADSAANLANFSIPGLTISSAVLDSVKRTITLTTSPQVPGLVYQLSVSGVRDRTTQQLLIAPGSMANFSPSALANGSFENDFTGWTTTGNVEIRSATPYIPTNGAKLVAFNTGQMPPNGTLSQTFATTIGQTYQLSFDVSILAYNNSIQRLGVAVNGSGNLVSQTISITGQFNGATPWQAKTYSFVANSATSTVTFSDLSTATSGLDLLLDNVQIGAQTGRSLAVTSTSSSGVTMTISPADTSGNSNGATGLIRSYNNGTAVTVTAPGTFGGATFLKWQKNGVDLVGAGATTTLTMDTNHSLNAVFGTNNAPVAVADAYSGFSDTQLVVPAIGVLTNDTDADGGQLTALLNAAPLHGTLLLNPNGSFTYTPNNGYQGSDSFSYHAYDGVSNSNVVTVSLSINPGTIQLITNGSFESFLASWNPTGNMLMQGAAPYVASNGTYLVAFNAAQATPNGTISQSIPTVAGQTYQLSFNVAALAYNTNTQRLQAAVDGSGNLLSQTTTVTGVGTGMTPWVTKTYSFVANSATSVVTFRDLSTSTSGIDLLLDNVRVMGSTPSYTLTVASTPVSGVSVGVSPADRNADSSGITGFTRTYSAGTIVNLTVPPLSGVSSFVKWQQNGADFSNTPSTSVTMGADMTLTAIYGANTAPVAVAENHSTPLNTALTVTAPGVLGNDTDGELNPLTAVLNAGPGHGTLTLDPDGGFTYTPTTGYTGPDSFTYHASDGSLDSNVVTVTLSVVGGVPSALANGSFEADETGWTMTGNRIVIPSSAPYLPTEGNKLMVFNGGNTQPNAVVSQTFATTPGLIYVLSFDVGTLAITSDEQRLGVGLTGSASLLSQTLSLVGNGTGNAIWTNRSFSFTADSLATTLTFSDLSTPTFGIDLLLDNVRIGEKRTLTVASSPATGLNVLVSPPDADGNANGITQFIRSYGSGNVVSLTAPATSGASSFLKWRKNGADFSTSAATTVTVDANLTMTAVYGTNDAPVAAADSYSATYQTQLVVAAPGVLDNDSDPESAALTAVLGTGPTHGTLTLNPNGGFSYTPANGFSGSDSFTYHANDGSLNSSTVTVTIGVTAPSLLANGGFESGETGWTVTGNRIVYDSAAPYLPSEGSKFMIFNGGNSLPNAVVSQSFATTPGQSYSLSFDLGILALNSVEQRLQIALTGSTTLLSQTESVFGNGQGNSVWTPKTFAFTADSATTTLTFTDVSATSSLVDLMLDNVRVNTGLGRSLTVVSTPANGVAITLTPADLNGSGTGTTQFTRTYADGAVVTLTAPATSGTDAFVKWRKNGADLTTDASTTVTMDGNHTLTAVYQPTVVVPSNLVNGSFESDFTGWTTAGNLGIQSSAPYAPTHGTKLASFNGANQAPNGTISQAFATTPGATYTLEFDAGALAYNTSAQSVRVALTGTGSLLSQTITVNGLGGGTTNWLPQSFTFTANSASTTLSFTDVSATTSMLDLVLDNVRVSVAGSSPTAHVLTVNSTPAAGVAIAVTPSDNNASGNGSTQFVRTYNEGAAVTLTAPATSGASTFVKWQKNGADLTTDNAANVTMDADHTLTAVYSAAPPSPVTFVNGNFESALTGWTTSGSTNSVLLNTGHAGTNNTTVVAFNSINSPTNGVLSQVFNTTPGTTYTVTFDMGVLAYNTSQQRLQISAVGTGSLLSETFSLNGIGGGAIVWVNRTASFTANSASTTLTFSDLSTTTSSLDLLLDNVVVTGPGGVTTRTLTVASTPATGVSITVTPSDNDTNGNGTTQFIRTYNDGTAVTLTAPATSGGSAFVKWQKNGSDHTTNTAANVIMDADCTLTAVYSAAPPAATFVNGSFEADETGWTVTGNRVVIESSAPYLAVDGTKLMVFNSGNYPPNAVVSQTFATTPGVVYSLAFHMGILAGNSAEQRLRISLTGAATLIPTTTESLFGNSQGNAVWTPKNYTFTADSTSATLTFTDVSPTSNGLDLLLDHVRVGPFVPPAAPVAVADDYSINHGGTLVVPANGVLGNDTDANLDNLTAVLNDGPANGSLTLNPNGGFTYTPSVSFIGTDTFTYHANDGALDSNVVTVSIEIIAPEILLNGSFESGETAWTMSGNRTAYDSAAPYTAFDGTKLLILNGGNTTPNAVVSQSFGTVPGQPYLLTFQMGVLALNAAEQRLQVAVTGATPLITPAVESVFGNSLGTAVWTAKSYAFTADSTTTTITLTDLSPTTSLIDLLLDKVSVKGPSGGPINTPPVAVGETYSTNQNTALVVPATGVLANDTDFELSPLTAVIDTNPGHGSVTLNANGGFTYTPTTGYTGPDSFTYRANDGLVNSNAATVTITVLPTFNALVNGGFEAGFAGWTLSGSLTLEGGAAYAPPEGLVVVGFNSANQPSDGVISQTFTTTVGQSYTLAFDVGVLSFSGNTSAQKMRVTANGTASLLTRDITLTGLGTGNSRWAPYTSTFVADSTTTTVAFSDLSATTSNVDLLLDNVRITLTPSGPNTAPVAVADSYSVNKNTPLIVAAAGVLLNDSDPQSNLISAVLATGPSHGTLNLSPYGGFTYTPANNYTGTDTFTYRANDGSLDSNLATVTIYISQPLLVNGSFESAFTGWTVNGTLTLESGAAYAPTQGLVVAGFNSANLAPNGIISQSFATVSGQAYTLTFDVGVLSFNGDTSPQKMLVTANGTSSLLSRNVTLNGLGGGASIWAPQTFSFMANSASTTLAFSDISATTTNTDLLLDNVRVTLGVTGPNTAPLAVADAYSTTVDTQLVIAAAGVLSNDSDFHFNPLTALLSTGPSHGTLSLNPNGGFTYTPTTGYTGPDAFTYRANDGSLDSNIVTVTINVNAAGPPVAVTFVNGGFESGFSGWTLSGSLTLESGAAYAPPQGLVVAGFNSANLLPDGVISQAFTTVPGQNYTIAYDVGVLSFSGNTSAQKIQVRANGNANLLTRDITLTGLGTGNSRWAPYTSTFIADSTTTTLAFSDLSASTQNVDLLLDNVRISLTPSGPNTAPVAVADTYSTDKNIPIIVAAAGVLLNDSDPQSNLISAVLATGPSHGTLNLSPYGGFTYTPANNYTGPDSFTYRANDGSLDSNLATVSITVTQPLLVNGSFESGFTAWTVTGTLTLEAGAAYAPTQGLIVAGFNSANTTPDGVISQTFATVAGQAYTLNFDLGVLSFNGNTSPQKMLVTVNGTGNLLSQNITLNGLGGGASIWAPQAFTFLANSASTTLAFSDQSATTTNTDLLLDRVRVSLGVTGPNTAPVAVADSYTTNVSTPLVVAAAGVLTNDSDPQSNPLTALLSTGPSNGTLTLNPNGGFTYTPTTGYTGPDSFTYRANDGSLDSNIVTVAITVNNVVPPTPVDFVNGSFESAFTGWTTSGSANSVKVNSIIPATDGSTLVEFNSGNSARDGVLAQTFATTPGLLYTVTFDMGVLAYNTSQQRIEVSAVGTGSLLSQIFSMNGVGGGAVIWSAKSVSFTANSASTTLTFSDRSTTGDGLDLLLDHVQVSSSTPPTAGPFVNGSFESGFTGWGYSGSTNSTLLTTSVPGTNGTTLVVFNSVNSPNDGVVTQTFATTPGTSYTVTFDMGVLAYNTNAQRIQVTAMGSGSLLSQIFTRNGTNGGAVTWATQTASFTANSASTILTFSDVSTSTIGLDLLLDYVRVTAAGAPSSIPAPPPTTEESEHFAAETAVTTVPANPGTLGSMSLSGTPGSFRVGMNAVETGLYILERSEDLKAWNYHSEIQVTEPGPIEFQDNETPKTRMFYRIGRQAEELNN